ncbi:MAG: hypothetical protein OEO20_11345 [Gemmatimonadota bacterium]|nr:hypothetical protein [Gemmatimonadota bacterium]MDH3291596.1 hypothetical protein [Gemmatimonadota bacterium]MDH3366499.1 hypothetical protein [Gemmatimonadota bacterium]MDH3478888.1 hypothetical protein [Gemmatimonadota bacterium]MDH3571206.1 hypothetical protein [Gemmatimonadota bacterium]
MLGVWRLLYAGPIYTAMVALVLGLALLENEAWAMLLAAAALINKAEARELERQAIRARVLLRSALAHDTFTDANGTDLTAHTPDSGFSPANDQERAIERLIDETRKT